MLRLKLMKKKTTDKKMTKKRKHGIVRILKICLFYIILFLRCWGTELLERLKGNPPWWILASGKEREKRIKKLQKIKSKMRKKFRHLLN